MGIVDRIRLMLLGKEFSDAGRICDLVRLFFQGEAEVTLLAQCFVRVLQGGRLIASSEDMFAPTIDIGSSSSMDFEWNQVFSAYDFSMKDYLEHASNGIVTNVRVCDWGDMILSLDNGSEIQVLTDSELQDREQWRIFRQGTAEPQEHIVRYPQEFRLE